MRIGLVVNPDAGLAAVAFKGGDGRAAEARSRRRGSRSRMNEALRAFADLLASPLNRQTESHLCRLDRAHGRCLARGGASLSDWDHARHDQRRLNRRVGR